MYQIEQTGYGFKVTFYDETDESDMMNCLDEIGQMITKRGGGFSVFTDMQTLTNLSGNVVDNLIETEKGFKKKGLERSVVILNNDAMVTQFRQTAMTAGNYEWERYIDSETDPRWEESGMNWITKGVDPEKKMRM